MKERKQSKDWYIAATHWLTAGFAIPFIIALVVGIPAIALIGKNNTIVLTIIMSAVWILSIWLGVMYAAKYVNKTYIVKNNENIAKLATIYLGVLGGGYRLINLSKGITTESIIDIVFFVVGVTIFYTLSKKYIKNSEVATTQQ